MKVRNLFLFIRRVAVGNVGPAETGELEEFFPRVGTESIDDLHVAAMVVQHNAEKNGKLIAFECPRLTCWGGLHITCTYDQLNRLTLKTYPDTTTVNYTSCY